LVKKTSNESSNSEAASNPELGSAAGGIGAAPAVPFEQALSELERIVHQMENGSLSLEQSLASYKRGVTLVASCRDSLNSARQQVKILEGDLMKPFDFERED
jgi:exodeoxyribonuclease VII small subunit